MPPKGSKKKKTDSQDASPNISKRDSLPSNSAQWTIQNASNWECKSCQSAGNCETHLRVLNNPWIQSAAKEDWWKGYLSLHLQRVVIGNDDQEFVNVKIKWLVTQKGKEIFSKSGELIQTIGITPLSCSFGWDKVVDTDSFKMASYDDQHLITNGHGIDKLKIACQLLYVVW